jgi:hypothetical protein
MPYKRITFSHIFKNGDLIKLTQNLHEEYKFGHFYWYIENKDSEIINAGSSTGAAPDKVGDKDLFEIYKRYRIQ